MPKQRRSQQTGLLHLVKGTTKLSGEKLDKLLQHLSCKETELADYGYFPTDNKANTLNANRKATLIHAAVTGKTIV